MPPTRKAKTPVIPHQNAAIPNRQPQLRMSGVYFTARTSGTLGSMEAGPLVLSLLIGSVGTGLFIYGKRQTRVPQLVVGLALMIYPYFVPNLWAMGGVAVGLGAALWGALRMGY